MRKGLIFSLAYFPRYIGGAEIAIKEITDRISSEEIQFSMITARLDKLQKKEEKIGNIIIYRVGFGVGLIDKFIIPITGLLKANSLHRKEKFDFIWAMMANQAGVAASFFSKRKKIPMILTMQEGDEEEHLKRYVLGINFLYKILIKPWYLLSIKTAQKATVISQYLKDRLIQAGFKGKIKLIPNGVDIERFSKEYSEDMLNMSRQKMGFSKDDIIIVTASRLVEKNAVDDLVKSLEFLPTEYKLLVLGDGKDENKIRRILKEKSLEDRAVLIGFVEPHLLPFYFKLSDVFARPSRSEGMGNAFLEAMAAQIPIVGTSIGGIKDFLFDKETGFVTKVNNSKDLAETIIEAYENKDKVLTKARKKSEEYEWNIIANKMKKVFLEI